MRGCWAAVIWPKELEFWEQVAVFAGSVQLKDTRPLGVMNCA